MSSVAEIRRHLRSVEDTYKITRAMYTIASSKMRRAVARENRNQTYFNAVRSNIRYLLESAGTVNHPCFTPRPGFRSAYLVIAADAGMCGSYNSNVLSLASQQMEATGCVCLMIQGQKAREYFTRRQIPIDIEFLPQGKAPSLDDARQITYQLMEFYETDHLDEVYVVYTQMESTTRQTPRVMQLLPIEAESFADAPRFHAPSTEIDFHPSVQAVTDALVPQYLIGLIYSALVQSFASEQCARMAAMDASNRNAEEMRTKLTAQLNRARQAAITQELTEIIAGAEGMAD